MKICFKTGGLLSEILPAGTIGDEIELDINEGAKITDMMALFGLPEDDFYLVILNDQVVPKAQRAKTGLKEGDELGIFPPLKGG